MHLRSVATTSPIDAPFRAAGGPAFTGLPIGDVTVAGVPFSIVDPAANGGKGIVVLRGAEACEDLPSDAVVLAGGARGRFLCILGNVTGWAPGDPGTGPWGAVGEYEVRYADGSRQVIPRHHGSHRRRLALASFGD